MSKRFVVGLLIVIAVLSIPFAWMFGDRRSASWGRQADQVAVVYVTGTITTQSDVPGPPAGGVGPVLDFLADIRRNDNIRAVVLRVDSGGGSAAASQEIHRAVLKVREAGKPVVVSMGEMAASGGYYVSVAADHIVANPSTVTGSIGVITQFLNFSGFAEKYGFSLDTVTTGPYKDLGNPTRSLSDEERAVMRELLLDSYDQFIEAIAEGRGLSKEDVRAVADGRLITGRQAMELGLIDGFGGLEEAIEIAARLAQIPGEPEVFHYTQPIPWYRRYLSIVMPHTPSLPGELGRSIIDLVLFGPDLSLRY